MWTEIKGALSHRSAAARDHTDHWSPNTLDVKLGKKKKRNFVFKVPFVF